MLGEAATTAEDAARYLAEYERADPRHRHAPSHKRGIYEGPGISIKLSALHPRYQPHQARPRDERTAAARQNARGAGAILRHRPEHRRRGSRPARAVARSARGAVLSIRSLPAGTASASSSRPTASAAPFVIDWLDRPRAAHQPPADGAAGQGRLLGLARSSARRSTGWTAFRSSPARSTPTSPISPAPASCWPRRTRSFRNSPRTTRRRSPSVMAMAGPNFYRGQYEFQCLHGMGEPLYEEVVGRDKLDRPCRIYAPVGTHETLLAYLVRRLLENGANTSFVNRIADASVPIEELIADPVAVARAIQPLGAPHRAHRAAARSVRAGAAQFARARLLRRAAARGARDGVCRRARTCPGAPFRPARLRPDRASRSRNPADHARRRRRHVAMPAPTRSKPRSPPPLRPRPPGPPTPPNERAAILRRAADALEDAQRRADRPRSCARPASPTPNAVAEVREAVDFLRYYAAEAIGLSAPARPRRLGSVVCISPWNFPAGDLHRPGRRGARRRQCGARQARRGDAADRRGGGAASCTRPACRRTRCSSCPARARSARRWSPTRACRASCSPARRRSRG